MSDTPREFADNSLLKIAIDWHRIAGGRDMDLRGGAHQSEIPGNNRYFLIGSVTMDSGNLSIQ